MNYKEQLLHPKWQKKRLEILERDEFMCRRCGDTEKTLHVHHRRYLKGRKVWEYQNEDLVTLCRDCHDELKNGVTYTYMLSDVGRRSNQFDLDFSIKTPNTEIEYKGKIYYLSCVHDDILSLIHIFQTREYQKYIQDEH